MLEKTRRVWCLYKEGIPKEPLRRKVFILSQLLLLTAVPGMTVCQWLGGYWTYLAVAYLAVLCYLTLRWSCEMHRELMRAENARKVADRLRGDYIEW